MVRIAVAGGTGSTSRRLFPQIGHFYHYIETLTPQPDVATELLRAPIRSGHHEITIFTRSRPINPILGLTYKVVDYHNLDALTQALQGFHTVLSFLIAHLDTNNITQKNLIHASIAAGVRRFAPSEWALASNSGVPPYENKDQIASYLSSLKLNGKLGTLEYCLFQPSVFMDYFAHPYPLSPKLITWPFFLDFENKRAMVLDSGDQEIVITAVKDVSEILALALDDKRKWPEVGGIKGAKMCINELLTIGKKLRGGEWQIEYVKSEDVDCGELKTTWVPDFDHPVVPVESREAFSKQFVLDFFQAIKNGAWDVSNEFNLRFPQYKFIRVEEYLTEAWEGRL